MTADTLKDEIVTLLTDKLDVEGEITPETPFTALELDSLVMLEFAVLIEQRYGVEIPEEELLDAGHAAGVAALVLARQGSSATRT